MNNTNEEYFMVDGKKVYRQPVDVYSRVVGWMTPTKNWNNGKQSEFKDRKVFKQ